MEKEELDLRDKELQQKKIRGFKLGWNSALQKVQEEYKRLHKHSNVRLTFFGIEQMIEGLKKK